MLKRRGGNSPIYLAYSSRKAGELDPSEVKEGPFVSGEAKEIALWAPQDGSAETAIFLAKCHKFSQSNPSLF